MPQTWCYQVCFYAIFRKENLLHTKSDEVFNLKVNVQELIIYYNYVIHIEANSLLCHSAMFSLSSQFYIKSRSLSHLANCSESNISSKFCKIFQIQWLWEYIPPTVQWRACFVEAPPATILVGPLLFYFINRFYSTVANNLYFYTT